MSIPKTLGHQSACGGLQLCLGMEGSKPRYAGKASPGAISFLCGVSSVSGSSMWPSLFAWCVDVMSSLQQRWVLVPRKDLRNDELSPCVSRRPGGAGDVMCRDCYSLVLEVQDTPRALLGSSYTGCTLPTPQSQWISSGSHVI